MVRVFKRWWAWPATLAAVGTFVVAIAFACTPVGEDVHLFGFDLFGVCAFQERTGRPCASCGMTRSWVWAARADFRRAWAYNPAGLMLFVTLAGGALLGWARLLTRRPGLLAIAWRPLIFAWVLWAALYMSIGIQRGM